MAPPRHLTTKSPLMGLLAITILTITSWSVWGMFSAGVRVTCDVSGQCVLVSRSWRGGEEVARFSRAEVIGVEPRQREHRSRSSRFTTEQMYVVLRGDRRIRWDAHRVRPEMRMVDPRMLTRPTPRAFDRRDVTSGLAIWGGWMIGGFFAWFVLVWTGWGRVWWEPDGATLRGRLIRIVGPYSWSIHRADIKGVVVLKGRADTTSESDEPEPDGVRRCVLVCEDGETVPVAAGSAAPEAQEWLVSHGIPALELDVWDALPAQWSNLTRAAVAAAGVTVLWVGVILAIGLSLTARV